MGLLRPALSYFLPVFALGFVLGTVRTLWLAPAIGPTAAVAAELPVMLAASWLLARRVLRRHAIGSPGAALGLGLIAFALLLLAELALAITLAGQGPGDWAASLITTPGALGLAGQAVFALLPRAVLARNRAC
jgi:hypothetical protein